ncbi:TPA: glycosyltransferase, partial [Enterococcus faecium]
MRSVCIATFNGGRYLREQLDSILSQLSAEDEVVISDDGSVDDTWDILTEYAEKD